MNIIKILGVGSAGINMVELIAKRGITGVSLAVCDTSRDHLENSLISERIYLGDISGNLDGTGSDPDRGRDAAMNALKDIQPLFSGGIKMLIIVTGLGGGTGSGAAPIIAKAAKELDILTIAMVTTPFSFEGKFRKLQALAAIQRIKDSTDSFTVFSNDELRQVYGNLTLANAFAKSDEMVYDAIKAIVDMITLPGYINVDFKDIRVVLKDAGPNLIFSQTGQGPQRALKAIESAISGNPAAGNLKGAKYLLLNISACNEATMDEVSTITDYLQEEAGLQADLIWGNNIDKTLDEGLRVTIIATGFSSGHTQNEIMKISSELQKAVLVGSEEKISLYFLEEEYSPDEIAEVISLLSDIYRSEGGDALIIKGQDIFEFTSSSIPAY